MTSKLLRMNITYALSESPNPKCNTTTQSRIIGAVREAHSQLWGTIIPVCFPYAPCKYDMRFGTPALV